MCDNLDGLRSGNVMALSLGLPRAAEGESLPSDSSANTAYNALLAVNSQLQNFEIDHRPLQGHNGPLPSQPPTGEATISTLRTEADMS